jgi:hypothetical protein
MRSRPTLVRILVMVYWPCTLHLSRNCQGGSIRGQLAPYRIPPQSIS